MKEISVREQKTPVRLDAIAQEYDYQREYNNPFGLMKDVFGGYKNGPVVLAFGFVGGGGASEKGNGIIEQFDCDGIPYTVVAGKKYLQENPLIEKSLKEKGIEVTIVGDEGSMDEKYKNCEDAIRQISKDQTVSGVLSLGPRTFFAEAAKRMNIPAMMLDGAVPDKSENTINPETSYPDTAYSQMTYEYATYATTCGFPGWTPPKDSYPERMNLKVVQQPFSESKNEFMKKLRELSPKQARAELLKKNSIVGLDEESLIVVPTMDQVYLNTMQLVENGGFMTTEQFSQTYSFMLDTIVSSVALARKRGEKVAIYLRPGIIQNVMSPVLEQFEKEITILSPQDKIVSNDDWLLLRKAGIAVGRAPLCVSTAEALGMGDYQITAAVPGLTGDGVSYMTEYEGLKALNRRGISKTLFPGDSLLAAMEEVVQQKGL